MSKTFAADLSIDLAQLRCPLPVLRTKKAMAELGRGQVLEVLTTDPTSSQDIPRFVELARHRLLAAEETATGFRFLIQCER